VSFLLCRNMLFSTLELDCLYCVNSSFTQLYPNMSYLKSVPHLNNVISSSEIYDILLGQGKCHLLTCKIFSEILFKLLAIFNIKFVATININSRMFFFLQELNLFSSPEHNVVMVSYCDLPPSVVVRRQQFEFIYIYYL
jgi:hypothetical protein